MVEGDCEFLFGVVIVIVGEGDVEVVPERCWMDC